MNFDSIEGLSDKDLNELFENINTDFISSWWSYCKTYGEKVYCNGCSVGDWPIRYCNITTQINGSCSGCTNVFYVCGCSRHS